LPRQRQREPQAGRRTPGIQPYFRLVGFEVEHAGGYPRLGRLVAAGYDRRNDDISVGDVERVGFKRADGLSRRGTLQRYISLFDSLYTGPLNSAFRGVP